MGCVGQKNNRKQQQNMLHLQCQSIQNLHQKKKMCIEFQTINEPKPQIYLYRSIDMSKDQEFALKSVIKFIPKTSESPNSTPKFNENLHFRIGIVNHRNKVIL